MAATRDIPRLQKTFREEVIPKVMKEFGLKNPNQVPKVAKIIVSTGVGKRLENQKLKPEHRSAELIVDSDTGEVICNPGQELGEKGVAVIQASALKTASVITNPGDSLILNTIAHEDLNFFADITEYQAALLKIYGKLRPGNPPQVDKAVALFKEKFFDENRYRLGRVGRFRMNRKFEIYKESGKGEGRNWKWSEADARTQHLRAEDFLEARRRQVRVHIDEALRRVLRARGAGGADERRRREQAAEKADPNVHRTNAFGELGRERHHGVGPRTGRG